MSSPPKQVVVTGAFDDLRSHHIRFLEEASRLGELTILLWPDEAVHEFEGKSAKFPFPERLYLLKAIRYVTRVIPAGRVRPDELPAAEGLRPDIWADLESAQNAARRTFSTRQGLHYQIVSTDALHRFPKPPSPAPRPGRKKVIVTGCYDWLHSGHVRFFEEVSAHGDLYVVVGHDANIQLLKGPGHPLFPQEERRYLVGSIRHVTEALISTGHGWLDADPEIQRLKPDIYAVNEDGDRGGKREYCRENGIEYLVLKRIPAPGLPGRSSTELRGK
jgi:cytidyltransferase-like protein